MKSIISLRRKKLKDFIIDEKAVLGLPMRLTVSIIIGTAAMIAILAFILNPCIFPEKMIVSVNPIINTISTGDSEDFSIDVHVTDVEGRPIYEGIVIIKGLGDVGSGKTNSNGDVTVPITATLQSGQNEGYLDLIVKCSCFEEFSQKSMIKVVRG